MKKTPVFLSVALLVGMLATVAFAPTSRAGKLAALPFEFHGGLVTAFTQGVGIMLQEAEGNIATYSVDSNVKILPPWMATELRVGSRVTLIVRPDSATQGLQAFGIFVLAPLAEKEPPADTPTAAPPEKPVGTPMDTPTPKPELPTEVEPTNKPTGIPVDTPTTKPLLPTVMPPQKATATPTFTPTFTPTTTPMQ